MDEDILNKYKKAGKILSEAREFGASLIKPGVKIIDVVEKVEERIKKLGGEFAFPVNVSINQNAAHDTADVNDVRVFNDGDIIKLDIGVHVDGYIADSARTISLNSGREDLIKASEKALSEALKMMRPGNYIRDVSDVIERTIREMGFNPVMNLTGHGIERYKLHAGIEIPNVRTNIGYQLKEGDVFAIEPFSTDGGGKVIETDKVFIYMYLADKPVRFPESRKILSVAREEFHKLPFTKRWLIKKIPTLTPLKLNLILRQLVQNGSLHDYPVLREVNNGFVAQTEHTVVVRDNPIITTL
ncbi:MAG: type II methionyl aminopeptidase [Candidatus Aenigmarchaeota archaeon]|nr:type II methionyl aminopeptidase [Candidatus Aenigmarchaeota archaeon]